MTVNFFEMWRDTAQVNLTLNTKKINSKPNLSLKISDKRNFIQQVEQLHNNRKNNPFVPSIHKKIAEQVPFDILPDVQTVVNPNSTSFQRMEINQSARIRRKTSSQVEKEEKQRVGKETL